MIQPASDLMAINVHARGPTELIAREDDIARVTFVRYNRRYGIVVVVS